MNWRSAEPRGASLAVYASAPVLYFITITLLRQLAPRGSEERQFT